MNRLRMHSLLLAVALGLGACATTGGSDMLAADAPRALPEQGPVQVSWNDPATFSELRFSGNNFAAQRGPWLTDLAEYLRTATAKRLPEGHRLELTIVDVKRAGQYEPWLGADKQDVRIMRDIYPPRLTLHLRELDAAGNVVVDGERKLSSTGYLTQAMPINNNDSLRFEKEMIDDWLRRADWRDVAAR